jgi:hypothetical protein
MIQIIEVRIIYLQREQSSIEAKIEIWKTSLPREPGNAGHAENLCNRLTWSGAPKLGSTPSSTSTKATPRFCGSADTLPHRVSYASSTGHLPASPDLITTERRPRQLLFVVIYPVRLFELACDPVLQRPRADMVHQSASAIFAQLTHRPANCTTSAMSEHFAILAVFKSNQVGCL